MGDQDSLSPVVLGLRRQRKEFGAAKRASWQLRRRSQEGAVPGAGTTESTRFLTYQPQVTSNLVGVDRLHGTQEEVIADGPRTANQISSCSRERQSLELESH